MRRIRASFWVCLAFLGCSPAPSRRLRPRAQVRARRPGGISLDPDQFYFGGHIETSPLVDRLRFRPSVDIGLGDDITLVAGNFDFTYAFPAGSRWNLYVGGGPTINWYDFDDGDSDTEGGFNFIVGAKQIAMACSSR